MTFRNILAASAATVTLALVTTSAMADTVTVFGKNGKEGYGAKFAVIQRFQPNRHGLPPAGAPTWSYSFKYGRRTYTDAFIGTAPTTNSTTTIPVYLVPMAMTYGSTTYDPTKVTANGVSIVQNVLNSPLFQSSVNYTQGGTNIGTTQYEDAFQRATLWGTAKSYPNWHTIFGTPTVEPVQTYNVGTHGELINAFGASNLILANINYFNSAIQKLIGTLNFPAPHCRSSSPPTPTSPAPTTPAAAASAATTASTPASPMPTPPISPPPARSRRTYPPSATNSANTSTIPAPTTARPAAPWKSAIRWKATQITAATPTRSAA